MLALDDPVLNGAAGAGPLLSLSLALMSPLDCPCGVSLELWAPGFSFCETFFSTMTNLSTSSVLLHLMQAPLLFNSANAAAPASNEACVHIQHTWIILCFFLR